MLAGTQALRESFEYPFTRDRLDSSRIDLIDAMANLAFPFLTKIKAVHARSDGFNQICAIPQRQF